MSLWAIIPVKPLQKGKSRLSSVLSKEERFSLNEGLLVRTIEVLNSLDQIDQILVISSDQKVLSLVRDLGARTVQEEKLTNVNNALRRATIAATAFNATKTLIIPADLPFINKKDLEDFLSLQGDPPEIIISSDRFSNGTNALFINPIGILEYDYGKWSFRSHIERAERKKINVKVKNIDSLTFDLDVPEDLELFHNLSKINSE